MEHLPGRDFRYCYNIYGPSSKAKNPSKIQNKVWILTQICHAISVVVQLQNKKKLNAKHSPQHPTAPILSPSTSLSGLSTQGSSYVLATAAQFF